MDYRELGAESLGDVLADSIAGIRADIMRLTIMVYGVDQVMQELEFQAIADQALASLSDEERLILNEQDYEKESFGFDDLTQSPSIALMTELSIGAAGAFGDIDGYGISDFNTPNELRLVTSDTYEENGERVFVTRKKIVTLQGPSVSVRNFERRHLGLGFETIDTDLPPTPSDSVITPFILAGVIRASEYLEACEAALYLRGDEDAR